ncbi:MULTISPECIES: helix-turn-helix transcriptional regulator [Xanthomonas]|uniref:DNA-binding protein n=1 Tax=Xanthomonas phaseoli pv. dieffenbachiae TaxID=92828 RepID=A0A1V9HBH7_9XANT|nr:YafY family protein [Xanthomonas phaseoli]MBO9769702.1 YafY family transcriptional regulator [Xanthomonas phaseoli pv. dieffenbachiae]MBO9777864.1 YafY family transcriptional regulator [Xanthomonas phaseoli pv. dieffenbachiae]MBO9782210.1 YafY family transcriptional regulator [Xanthomonas phaseoli pv. dieffenbachiae]MBO9790161.1 YafY family transcriptional regulator [Xanthomonas phaseoli pv. dieffenbachiae]MBO9798261.1 YafY family transcriptional regulator [Xanthomonas phaseoli pv. dieffenb
MSRSQRLFDILEVLRRSSTPVSGAALASETGTSLRTLYRDVTELQALGANIEGEAGIGYVLKHGYVLPTMSFTEDELHALIMGAQWVTRQTDPDLALAARNAIGKIGAVIAPEMKHRLHDEQGYVGRQSSAPPATIDFKSLRRALREQRKIEIAYVDDTGSTSTRRIWPILIGFIESRRFLAAWCELRNDFRLFRLDRVAQATILDERYTEARSQLLKRWRTQNGFRTNDLS